MLSEYLTKLGSKPHAEIFKFFTNLHFTKGLMVAIGFNEGNPIKHFRLYNRTFRIAQFEQDPFKEKMIKAMNWVAGKDFEYHMVRLSNAQSIDTVFVPRVNNTRLAHAATNNADTLHAYRDHQENAEAGQLSKKGIDEIAIETRIFDHYKLPADIIVISPDHFEREVVEGMANTIMKYQPIFVVPNLLPTIFDVHEFLLERKYRAYSYEASNNRIIPFENNPKAELLLYIHTFLFETAEPMDL